MSIQSEISRIRAARDAAFAAAAAKGNHNVFEDMPLEDLAACIAAIRQGQAIQIDTAEEMETLATAANGGNVYQYVGEQTELYTPGNLYLVSKRFGSSAYQLVEFEIPKTLGEKSIAANGTYIANRLTDDADGWNKIIVNVGSSDGIPIEVGTAEEMNAFLTEENVGKMYHYMGESAENYKEGYFYLVCAMTLMDLSESTQCYFLEVSEALRTGETTITANGTYEPHGLIKAWDQVTVNVPFAAVYRGTEEPDAALGADGDIYLMK